MQGILDYFASSPEAVAALLVFALGAVGTTIVLLIGIFARYPLVARVVARRSLVHVDSALRDKVHVTFSHRDGTVDVKELRQIDYEILNSHPRRSAEACTITINLRSPDATVLGVSAANSDNRTPRLGGRRTVASVEDVPAQPGDPILDLRSEEVFPAVVVRIPYLARATQDDRVFLRITYDGPPLDPEVQGAKLTSGSQYRDRQLTVWLTVVVFSLLTISALLVGAIMSLAESGVSWSSIFVMGIAVLVLYLVMRGASRRWHRWVRLPPNPLLPPPFEVDSLAELRYYDAIQDTMFIDRFDAGAKGWTLNYWGSPDSINRIENSFMVFEATEDDLEREAFGAYFDLRNGIYQGNRYEVKCRVKSDENTTMKFCLWLHDTIGGASSIRTDSKIPSTRFEEFKLEFTANETEAIRIHLHNEPGVGRVIVDEVVVRKIWARFRNLEG